MYSHYWTWHTTPDINKLKQCIADMARIVREQNVCTIRGWDGTGEPLIEELAISFNGDSEARAEYGDTLDHETFSFPGYTFTNRPEWDTEPESVFNFCKTARKPYDAVVTACLLVARDHFDESVLSINSDGWWHEWANGYKLYYRIFGREPQQVVDEQPQINVRDEELEAEVSIPDDWDADGREWVDITLSRNDAESLRELLGDTDFGMTYAELISSVINCIDMALYPQPPDYNDDFPMELEYPNEPMFPQDDGTWGPDERDG